MKLSPIAGNFLIELEECGEEDIAVLSWAAAPDLEGCPLRAITDATRELSDLGLVEVREYMYFGPQKPRLGPLELDPTRALGAIRERLARNQLGEFRWALSDGDDLKAGVVRVRLRITERGLSEVLGEG